MVERRWETLDDLTAFAVVAAVAGRRRLADFRGLAAADPWAAAGLLLSLVGTPPTAVFADKPAVFTAAWDGGQAWPAVVAAANTVPSLVYYLRWIVPAFGSTDTAATDRARPSRLYRGGVRPRARPGRGRAPDRR